MGRMPSALKPCWGLVLLITSILTAIRAEPLPHGDPSLSPSHHLRILTPHDNNTIRTDQLLVVVDVTGLGVPLGQEGGKAIICLSLGPLLDCSHDYQLGSQAIGTFAKLLDVQSLPPASSHHTLTALAVINPQSQVSNHQEVLAQDQVEVSLVAPKQCTPRAMRRKVYDSFIFFDELDLLELRLKELGRVVDGFILIESDITHSRLPKPLHFQNSKHEPRFAPYIDRIIHVVLPEEFLLQGTGPSHWDRETRQRDALASALRQYMDKKGGVGVGVGVGGPVPGPEDLILIADVDEVPRREVLEELRGCEEAVFPTLLLLDWHLYSLRWKASIPWGIIAREGPVVVTVDLLLHQDSTDSSNKDMAPRERDPVAHRPPSPTACRRLLRPTNLPQFATLPMAVLTSAGWHLSSFGGAQWLRRKLVSYADHVYNKAFLLEEGRIERLMHFGVPYFYLDAFSSLEDSFFLPASFNYPRDLPYAIQDLDGLSHPLRGILWPVEEAGGVSPDVTDERLLRQDFLQARYFLGNETRMTLPGTRRKPSVSFTHNCHTDYRGRINEFCNRMSSPDCHGLLTAAVERDCAASASSSHSLAPGDTSLDIVVEDSQLVPGWLFNQTFIVEYMAGDDTATVARRVCEEFRDKVGLGACLRDLGASLQQYFLGQPPAADTSSASASLTIPASTHIHAGGDSPEEDHRPASTPALGDDIIRKRAALMAPVLFPQLYPGCGRFSHPPLPTTDDARRRLAQGQEEIDLKLYDHFFANDSEPGVFLEIGAANGKAFSNTYFYEHALGWRGILIEPQPANAAQLMRSYRPRSARFTVAACTIASDEEAGELELTDGGGLVAHSPGLVNPEYEDFFKPYLQGSRLVKVPCVPLQHMIDSTGLFDINFFSLDVEGGEMAVLETVDLSITNVRVFLVEMGHSVNDQRVRDHLVSHGFIRKEMCQGKPSQWCAYSEVFINPDFEARKARQPPLPIQCEKYRHEGWLHTFGHMPILNTADHSCHVVGLVAKDGVLESPETIANRSCRHMKAHTGAARWCSSAPHLLVNASEDRDCMPLLTELIETVIEDNNANSLEPQVLIPVDVHGVSEYFFARSDDTVEEDAETFCKASAINLEEGCAASLTAAAKAIYASRSHP